jgi:hypothetical protein
MLHLALLKKKKKINALQSTLNIFKKIKIKNKNDELVVSNQKREIQV